MVKLSFGITRIQINIFMFSSSLVSVHSLGRSILSLSRCSSIVSSSLSLSSPFLSLNTSQEGVHIGIVMNGERSVLSNHSNGNIPVGKVHLIGEGVTEGPQPVLDQLLQLTLLDVPM